MKTLRFLLAASLSATALCAAADSKVTTLVDGTEIPKELTRLSFDGDIVILTFADDSDRREEMKSVVVRLDHQASSSIGDIIADPEKPSGVYDLQGRYLGKKADNLNTGFYIINGKKVYVK